jgi:integration host factor subunit alpha
MSQKLSDKGATTIEEPPAEPSANGRADLSSRTITRADLADAIHRRVGLSRAESAEFVEAVLSEIFQAIVSGDEVKLSSFGAFHIRWKNERVGRNPKTGASAPISARRVVMFKASNVLRARINGHRPSGKDN